MRGTCLLNLVFAIAVSNALNVVRAQETKANVSLNPLAKLEPGAFSVFVERPLFSPSRRVSVRPPAVEAADDVEEVDTTIDITLAGVTKGPFGVVARVVESDGTGHSIAVGDAVLGWTVENIGDMAVRLIKDGKSLNLSLFRTESQFSLSFDQQTESSSDHGDGNVPRIENLGDVEQQDKKVRIIKPD